MLFPATLAGSLPKPSWLAETDKLWPQWRAHGAALAEAKRASSTRSRWASAPTATRRWCRRWWGR